VSCSTSKYFKVKNKVQPFITERAYLCGLFAFFLLFCQQDDILTAAFCPPNYLATASFDGDIILWSLDQEKVIRRLKKGSGSLL